MPEVPMPLNYNRGKSAPRHVTINMFAVASRQNKIVAYRQK